MRRSRMVLLLSGGIDSPVAGYMLGRRGVELVALTGVLRPESDQSFISHIRDQVINLSNALGRETTLYIYDHAGLLSEIAKSSSSSLRCILCKRAMLRMAEALCRMTDSKAIIMGDSLGQVASQTLTNLAVIDQVVEVPVMRPLIGLDKVEIVRIAERIGSLRISNLETDPCPFLPRKPSTKAKLNDVLRDEGRYDIESVIEHMCNKLKSIDISGCM